MGTRALQKKKEKKTSGDTSKSTHFHSMDDLPVGGKRPPSSSDKAIPRITDPRYLLSINTIKAMMQTVVGHPNNVDEGGYKLVQSSLTEFILFLTSEAIQVCLKSGKKKLTGEHYIEALRELGFSGYVEAAQVALAAAPKRKRNRSAERSDEQDEEEGQGEDER